METYPVIIVALIGLTGFCLMIASFVVTVSQGGWQKAMTVDGNGKWPLPRRMMMFGALLGMLFGIMLLALFLIPGGIPWRSP